MNGILKKSIFFLLLIFSYKSYSEVCWADSVLFFSSQKQEKEYSANQAIGGFNTLTNSDSPTSWMPTINPKQTYESILLRFDCEKPVKYIFVNLNLGWESLKSINIIDNNSNETTIRIQELKFENKEGKLTIPLEKEILVSSIKLYLDVINSKSDVQLDAVGISYKKENPWVIDEVKSELFESESENMGIRINSIHSELAPIISSDGKKLFYTRDSHPENIGADKSQDVWLSELESDGRFGESKNLYDPINNKSNNFAFSTNSDGTLLLLGRNANNTKMLSYSEFENNRWSNLKEFSFPKLNNSSNYVNYSLSKSGKKMFISMERDDSFGGLDLYYSILLDSGWTSPMNMGRAINTAADEISPYIADDDQTLFFASNGYAGYGSMDLYVSKLTNGNQWSSPKNLGSKINTEGWEAYLTIPSDNEFAYFVSTSNSIGKEDIFRIKVPKQIAPKSSTIVSGKVHEMDTNSPIEGKVVFVDIESNEIIGIAYSDKNNGYYQITLPSGKHYGLNADADGYYSISQRLNLDTNNTKKIEINLELKKITKGETYNLNNIFFDFGKSDLMNSSTAELKRLVSLLENNENISIKIIGYTDQIGDEKSNLKLSEERAKAVYDYLISAGINQNRLSYEGKGELNSNKSGKLEENRKVVFKIIEDKK